MGEKLNKFIAFYTEKATANVNEKKAKVDEYKAERQNAIGSLEFSVSEKYPTLGDLVKDMFPENGGVNNDLFNNVYSKLATLSNKDKAVITKLNKLSKSQIQYDNANSLLNKGGEKYFNELLDVLKEDENVSLTDIIKGGIKGLTTFLAELDTVPESPPGIESSQELFDAIIEANSSASKAEPAKSPINQETTAEQGKEQPASQINAAESPAKVETGAPSSAITATEATTKTAESESKVVTTPEVINPPKTGESVTPEKTKKSEPTAPPAAEKTKEVEVINVGAKEVAQLEKAKVAEEKKQANIESITSKLNIKDETQKTKVQDILTRFAERKEKPSPLEGVTTNVQPNLLESFESAKEKAVAIGSIGAPSPTINQTTSTESVANFTNIGETSTSASAQTLNQSTQSTTSTASPTTTTINAPKTLTEKQQSIIDRYKSQMNILTPEEKKARAELEKSIKVESKGADLQSAESAVEKNKVEFKEKIPAAVAKTDITSNQNVQNISNPMVSQEQKPTAESSIAMTPTSPPTGGPESTSQSTAVVQDMSAIEKRLKNLEIILSSPLTVKIG